MSENNIDKNIIKNRESWFKIIILSVFSLVLVVKILTTPFSLDLSDVSFNDILSLVLALFAIGLSIAFYFKATETSNTFYDNTYKFAQELSQILGRIEGSFGEKLENLDKSSSRLLDTVGRDNNKVTEVTKELKEKEKERNEFIQDVVSKTTLDKPQKENLLQVIKTKDTELENLREQLEYAMSNIERSKLYSNKVLSKLLPNAMRIYLRRVILDSLDGHYAFHASEETVNENFKKLKNKLPKSFIDDLMDLNLLHDDFNLTDKGMTAIKEIARFINSDSHSHDLN